MDDITNLTDEELESKIDEATQNTEEVTESPAEPETPTEESTETEEQESEVEETEVTEETEETEEPKEEEAKPPSRREQLRIQQLLEKMKESKQAPAPQQPAVNYRDMIDADEEVIQQLESTTQDYGKEQYNAGLEQAKSIQFHTRLEIDAPQVESRHEQLNPKSSNFEPGLADAINTWYLKTVGYNRDSDTVTNPNIRYSDFVESVMELGEVIGAKKSQVAAKNVAKQATQTGLRPDGSQAKRMNLNQSPETMTNEELAAAIKASLPTSR